jgi:pimeloyl-ACP methyl ester carboxylesterase
MRRFALTLPLLVSASLQAAGVRVEFDPANPAAGPFPSAALTIPDAEQITGQRVQLPLPDCDARPADCAEIQLLNNLDGFHVNQRLNVRFSDAIDTATFADAVKIVWLDAVRPDRAPVRPDGHISAINQAIYDPELHTLFAKPDEILEGARRYLLIVTDAVRDTAGDPVEGDSAFTACLAQETGTPYCEALAAAVERVLPLLGERRIIGASLFTTQSTTGWYEQAREIVNATPPNFQRDATNPVVPMTGLFFASIRQHIAISGPEMFRDVTIPAPLGLLVQGGVRRVAFGSVRSPRFTNTSGSIAYSPTGVPLPTPAETEEIFFHVWLPAGPTPPDGYPVVLAGHGLGDSRFGMPTVLSLGAGSGFAVIAATAFGHGYGPESSVRLLRLDGSAIEVRAPGRALDLNGDGRYEASEGCVIIDAAVPTGARDCIRQTVVDYLQILHAIRDGIDLDGDGAADLSRDNISYVGQSLGSAYGAVLAAVAPEIRSVVLNVPPGFIT